MSLTHLTPVPPLARVFNDHTGLERVLKLSQNVCLITANTALMSVGSSRSGLGKGEKELEGMVSWLGVTAREAVRRLDGARGGFVVGKFDLLLLLLLLLVVSLNLVEVMAKRIGREVREITKFWKASGDVASFKERCSSLDGATQELTLTKQMMRMGWGPWYQT
jgi:hypothetical protein